MYWKFLDISTIFVSNVLNEKEGGLFRLFFFSTRETLQSKYQTLQVLIIIEEERTKGEE